VNKHRILGISLSILFFISCQGMSVPLLSDQEYSRLENAMGEEWNVRWEEDKIIMTSKTLCWFYNAVSLPYMTEDEFSDYVEQAGRQDYYEIMLLFVPKWDTEKINAAKSENQAIREEINTLPEKHSVSHLMRTKTNSFFPETKEDEKKVAAYDKEYAALQEKIIRIPDYEGEHYSVFVNDNRMGFEGIWCETLSLINMDDIFPR
jgi:hypothetical protein